MDETGQMTQEENLNSPKNRLSIVWTTILAVILTTLVVGGGMVWWKSKSEQELKQQIEVMQSQTLPVANEIKKQLVKILFNQQLFQKT